MPWDLLTVGGQPRLLKILAVHAALLPSNQVLLFGGSEHSFKRFSDFAGGIPLLKAQLLHLSGETVTDIAQSPDTDLFCTGHAFLGDGRLLAAGGTKDWPISYYGGAEEHDDVNPHDAQNHWDGEHACWVYNHWQGRWVRVRDLAFEPVAGDPGHQEGGGRWYPTLITLADGSVIALSGHPGSEHSLHENITPEIYSAGKDEWAIHADRVIDFQYGAYPRGHVLRDQRIFFPSPRSDGQCGIYDPADGNFTAVTTLPTPQDGRITERDFTTVMLPLLPGDGHREHILATGWEGPALRITLDEGTWVPAGARDWSGTAPERVNHCAVLLPTGQVALVGGVERTEVDGDLRQLDSGAVLRTEVYTPGIDWSTGLYDFSGQAWETDPQSEAATVPRNYHSGALLLPDGRVLTFGSNINALPGHPDQAAEKRLEVYRPWYADLAGRPQITGSPSSVTYDQNFTIEVANAGSIQRVAMMRLGSVTHSFDADQRYVGLQVINTTGGTVTVRSPPGGGVAPPGYYMLWVVDTQGRPCVRAPFIKLGHQGMFIVLDRSSISVHDVESMLASGSATFPNAVYVMMDGAVPNDFTPPTLTATMDSAVGEPAADLGISVPISDVFYDIGQQEGDTAQRITFAFNLRFADAEVFDSFEERRTIRLRAESGAAEAQAVIELHKQPNPFMIDGKDFWLSTDLRVFRVVEGVASPPLPVFPKNADPLDYLQKLLGTYDAHGGGTHPFELITEDQEASKLELAEQVPFPFGLGWPFDLSMPVYNFAVARVRYRSLSAEAKDVRVFFRLFNTVGTALEFDTDGTYRRSGDGPSATPLIGRDGKVILSIPFFGSARVDASTVPMGEQDDPTNRKTLPPTGGQESQTYFGCWLDFNQTTPRYPLNPTSDGPFGGQLKSLQELMRGYHQCLVAEIHFGNDLIPDRATPATSDKLSQRNLWIEEAPNPGVSPESRVVLSTCELQTTSPALTPSAQGRFDELMILWDNLPRDSRVTLFMPSVDAAEVVEAAVARHGAPPVRQVDEHTIELVVADVTYVPIPRLPARTIPGLLRVALPESISKGQLFRIRAHQFSDFGRPRNAPGEVIGSFELDIPVSTGDAVLPRLIHRYSVLKHVALAIPEGDRWFEIFRRYVDETGRRVRGLGQDPDEIAPDPAGTGIEREKPGEPEPEPEDDCGKPPRGAGVTGKIDRLVYDGCGDFWGFVLDLCPGERTFTSREPAVHRLVREACERRSRVTVVPACDDVCRVAFVEVHCT